MAISETIAKKIKSKSQSEDMVEIITSVLDTVESGGHGKSTIKKVFKDKNRKI